MRQGKAALWWCSAPWRQLPGKASHTHLPQSPSPRLGQREHSVQHYTSVPARYSGRLAFAGEVIGRLVLQLANVRALLLPYLLVRLAAGVCLLMKCS